MNRFFWLSPSLALWLWMGFTTEIALTQETPEDSTVDLENFRVQATGGVRFDSSGGGYDGVSQINLFTPLWQTPGSNLLYFDGRFLLDNGANVGTNLLLGYRFADQERLWGLYTSYDLRNTDDSTFHQLGFGLESKGTVDILLNGYFPVGETRNQTDSSSSTVATSEIRVTDSFFSGNNLLLNTEQDFNQIERRLFESAIGSVDLEIGGELLSFENGGGLRLYGKTYYLYGEGIDGTIGGGARLAVRPTRDLSLGLGFQSDGIFGTNLNLNLSYRFPSTARGGNSSSEESILARMGERVQRTPTVRVESQDETDIASVTVTGTTPAVNPDTGENFNFIQVSDGGNSDGTFEDPFGTITEAIAIASSSGNDIIYVRIGSETGLDGFAIPDNVQVLSSGVAQLIATQLGTVQLPESGTGDIPNISGIPADSTPNFNGTTIIFPNMVIQGNNTVLSGFNIIPNTAVNPDTGEPWQIIHVTDGTTGGDGTVESPLGEVTDAVLLVATDGNNIVYVDSGDNSGLDGFAIPDNVQVLSTGIEQFLETQVGTIQIPNSGTGVLPTINGASPGDATPEFSGTTIIFPNPVAFGENSILSGFDILAGTAVNPDTGDDWQVIHVTDGATGGDGTVESPFGSIVEALAFTNTSNDIVYVDFGDGSGFDGFAIPDNVQVLSQGLEQFIETQAGTVQLPDSGNGEIPDINGSPVDNTPSFTGNAIAFDTMVELGENSVLSGFNIVSSTASNPNTGEEWNVIHVTDGATGGDGTIESPFGTITEAVAIANSNGNSIVYVNAGDGSGFDGFTIPDEVQVLSDSIAQSIDTQEGTLQLPDSGTGITPEINGSPADTTLEFNGNILTFPNMVVLGTNSVLSEFTIDDTVRNSDTGEAWNVIHVTDGETGGDGTVESPFGTITEAVDIANSDGNSIVYVNAGDESGFDGFAIPDEVQVLSDSVAQSIDTQGGTLQLPNSGTGTTPEINGSPVDNTPSFVENAVTFATMVEFGENSVLSDFDIVTATATNPDTGEEWNVIHVTDGATGGDGTVESPFGTITEAVAIANSNGNSIVYVNAGDGSGFDGFTIPDEVQVLSDSIAQSIDTQEGTLQLPDSGTGITPEINGSPADSTPEFNGNILTFPNMVVLGTNSVLSEFTIDDTVRNSDTGEAWNVIHVTDGETGGDGTFESPFGTITEAVDIANSDGNSIVYVNAGDESGFDGFTIPDEVQVLSDSIAQSIDTQEGTIQLPDSGTGTTPEINGSPVDNTPSFTENSIAFATMVEFGTNSVLSDFDIVTATATNPDTGEDWNVIHVTDGETGGDGTFESPLGDIGDALTLTDTDGNSIVYVNAGDESGFDGFTIPDEVQVLSDSIAQSIDTQEGTIQLPDSGTGTTPEINGTPADTTLEFSGNILTFPNMVILGTNSVLSDFTIDDTVRNNATGNAWNVIHVTDGETGGDGTFESPFGTITEAVDIANSDGNSIVYVNAGDGSGFDGFTIPDEVQVLSYSALQFIDTQRGGTLELPDSGTGNVPEINGIPADTTLQFLGNFITFPNMVVFGTNSVLTDFDIDALVFNPDTGDEWNVIHVTDGATGGDGSFGSPLGDIATALTLTNTDGNSIVYVNAGDGSGFDGFTIPDEVQVLSDSVAQSIDTERGGTLNLPDSGTGTTPDINGTPADFTPTFNGNLLTFENMVILGTNSVLSDFNILTSTGINPNTGNPWNFIHVTDGATGGDGSFGSPLGEVTDGVAIALSDGNSIVYVDSGDGSGMDGFIIPDSVQVLSTGVLQNLDTQAQTAASNTIATFTTALPNSNTGTLPLVNGATVTAGGLTGRVSMGNDSTLSGLNISTTNANENGVVASNVSGIIIDRNQITTTGDTARGILISSVTDELPDGTIVTGELQNAIISGNTISTSGAVDAHGVYGYVRGLSVTENVYDADGNQVFDADGNPVTETTISPAIAGTFTVLDNTINTSGDTRGKGIYFRVRDSSTAETVTISGNNVSTAGNTNSFGIQVNAGTSTITEATVSGNTVTTTGNQGVGIYVRSQNNGGLISEATISGNTVTTTGNYGDAISVSASGPDATITTATVSGNTLSSAGNYADGIFIQTLGGTSTISSITVTDNNIQQAGVDSVAIQARNPSESICIAQFTGNTSSNPSLFDPPLFDDDGNPLMIADLGNDLNFNPTAGTPGTIEFVDFANINPTNTGFDDIVISNGMLNMNIIPVTTCP